MAAVFLKLLNMSFVASWLILAVLLARLVLKKAPKWSVCILWALVAIRLVCPFSLPSSFSALALTGVDVASDGQVEYFRYGGGTEKPLVQFDTVLLSPADGALALAPHTADAYLPPYIGVWLIGLAVLLLYAALSYLRLRKQVGASLQLRDNIWICDDIKTPFILGILKPRIYLPSGMGNAAAAHVLAHEQAHLQRRDHWWKPLGWLLLAVYWFDPLIWLAYILLCRDIELACDERVIRDMAKRDMIAYSEALLSCSLPRRTLMACPLAFGEVGVKERIKTVLNYKKPAFWLVAVAVVACLVLAVCFLTDPKADQAAAEPFGRNYSVEAIVYAAPQYNFSYTPQTAPDYRLSAERQLMILEDKDSLNWLNAGTFAEVSLSPLFDDYFKDDGVSGWFDGSWDAERLRRETQKVWRLDVSAGDPDNVFYLLLQLQNGDVYLTYGYAAAAEADALIRWVFKLGTASTTNVGGADAPAVVIDAANTYMYSVTVYINPLSSYYPVGTTGYLYKIDDNSSLTIMDEVTGEIFASVSDPGVDWSPLTLEQWQALFVMGDAPDISGVHQPRLMQLSDEYYLFDMDGGLWLGEYSNAKNGMWSVYELKLYEQKDAPAAADAPQTVDKLRHAALRLNFGG